MSVKVVRVGDQTWELTPDGYCAYCRSYRASWLDGCTNPIHTKMRAQLIIESRPPQGEKEPG